MCVWLREIFCVPNISLVVNSAMKMLIEEINLILERMKLPPEQGIFLFIRKQIIPPHFMLMSSLYKEYKDDDGFLYITYTNENTFG